MRWMQLVVAIYLVVGNVRPVTADPDDKDAVITALRKKVEELDQKVKALESREGRTTRSNSSLAETPTIYLDAKGLTVRSGESNFVLRVRGFLQADSRWYMEDSETLNDTFLMRRVRPIFEGTVFDRYDYRLTLDFGANTSGPGNNANNNGMLQDAYFNARLLPEFQVQVGKFKEPVGLERLQSGANLLFVERGYPTQLVPNRDVGLQIHGELWNSRLDYALGLFNGVSDGASYDIEASDEEKDLAARVFARPFKNSDVASLGGLGFGVAGTFGNQEGSLRPFVSPGQQRFFQYRSGVGTNAATANVRADGVHWRISPQAYYYWGPFGIFGEYVVSSQELRVDTGERSSERVANRAWQLSASYFLTGERNSFNSVAPRRPFRWQDSGWGGLELAARVGQLTVDDGTFPDLADPSVSAKEATSWGVGINWFLNTNLKLSLDYEQTRFKGGSGRFLESGEKVFLTRAQLSF